MPRLDRQLDKLITVCKQRGYHPVVLDLPRNMEVIGDAFDEATLRYQEGSRALATQHAVPFIDFVEDAQLTNDDFFDLDHLVDSGRPKYQSWLADETVRLLAQYGMQTTDGEGAGGAPLSPASGSRPRILWPVGVAAVLLGATLAVRRRRVVVGRRRDARRRQRAAMRRRAATRLHRPSVHEDAADRYVPRR